MARAGDVIGGKYRLIHPLGIGGMGTVWRAEHTGLKQHVAVKLLDARGPAADRAVRRFQREAQIAARIRHRNVVYISDFGSDAGAPYLVMELLQGVPLSERMVVAEPLGVAAFLRIIVETLDGLSAVHAAGVVHRDLKPENIFLVRDGAALYAKLLDFGVSRSTDRDQGHTITREGVVMGTPEYVSPEQARGRMADTRSDIYSAGVVMYEALAGRLPFQADNAADLIVAVLNAESIPLHVLRPDLGQELSDLVARAMSRDPSERFQSALEMRDALAGYLERHPESAERSLPSRFVSPSQRVSPADRLDDPMSRTLSSFPPLGSQPVLRLGRGFGPFVLASAGALVVLLGVLLLSSMGKKPMQKARVVHSDTAASVPALVEGKPVAPAPSEISVQLFGVPDDATVRADGVIVEGSNVRFERDSGVHEITVEAPGREPFRVLHDAASDGKYALALEQSRTSGSEDAVGKGMAKSARPRGVALDEPRRERIDRPAAPSPKKRGALLRTPDF